MPATMPTATYALSRPTGLLLLLIPIAFTAVAYRTVIHTYFHDDDFLYLYRIVNSGFLQHLLTTHGGHLLVTRNAVFALTFWLVGPQPDYFFWTVLLTHLVNVGLLFAVIRAATDSAMLACFGAVLWGTSPVHVETLTWYSVYGEVLATTILLWLWLELTRASSFVLLSRARLLSWMVLLLVASTCFGIGLAETIVFPLVVFLWLPAWDERRRAVRWLLLLAAVMPVLYVGVHRVHGWIDPVAGDALPRVRFSVADTWPAVELFVRFLAFGIAQLIFGALRGRLKFQGLGSYSLVALYTSLVAIAYVWSTAIVRRRMLACVVLAFTCYTSISVGRAALFTAELAKIATGQRYHYLALVPFTVLLCMALHRFGELLGRRIAYKAALLVVWLTASVIAYAWRPALVTDYPAVRAEVDNILDSIRTRAAEHAPGEVVYIPNATPRAFLLLNRLAPGLLPGWAALYAIYVPDNTVDGRRVRFVDPHPAVVAVAQEGKRSAELIVGAATTGAAMPHPPAPLGASRSTLPSRQ